MIRLLPFLLLLACAHSRDLRITAAQSGEHLLTHTPRGYRSDCSGFVSAAYTKAGLSMDETVQSLWERSRSDWRLHKRRKPKPGDIAFFDNTYDRNHNQRWDDKLTHVALVLEVARDGTVLLAHDGTSRGRVTFAMNLKQRHEHAADSGEVLNAFLRRKSQRDPARARYLAGELWRGFGRPVSEKPRGTR